MQAVSMLHDELGIHVKISMISWFLELKKYSELERKILPVLKSSIKLAQHDTLLVQGGFGLLWSPR